MTQAIVVGVNDSIPSRVAVDWGADRAAGDGRGSRLLLVHVVAASSGLPVDAADAVRAASGEMLLAERQRVCTRYPGMTVRTELREGGVAEELAAASADSDLFVMGTHKTGFIRGRILGSRGTRIAGQLTVPTAVIPASAWRVRSGVVVGVDDSASGLAALEFAATEAERLGQQITLVRAWDAPAATGERADDQNSIEHGFSAEAGRILADAVRAIHQTHPNLGTFSRRVRRAPAAALLDSAVSASLLVIGVGRYQDPGAQLGEVVLDVLVNLVGPTVIVRSGR